MRGTQAKGTEVPVPHLAESLVEATVGKWLKQPGDYVEQYEVICELLTEKVTVEMPCPIEGTLTEIIVGEGKTAKVGEALCLVLEPSMAGAAPTAGDTDDVRNGSSAAGFGGQADGGDSVLSSRFSPAVLKLAAEQGIDLKQVTGTGLGGRITRKDVLTYLENGRPVSAPIAAPKESSIPQPSKPEPAPAKPSAMPVRSSGLHLSEKQVVSHYEREAQHEAEKGRGEYFIDVTPVRNLIATRMRQSVAEIPHAWTTIELDVTNLVMLRNKIKDEFIRKEGFNLTYLAFVVKAVVNAIKDYPIMNSIWAVDKIIVKKDINISLAVGTEDSVITPVIKKADQKNIAGLARDIDELTKKARSGKLSLSDLDGGTFTVNNTGSFGSILSYPIINYPQAAILTFESIVKRPVVINDMIAVRSMVNMCLSLDHRILDGVICGRFLQRVKENLESYNMDTKLY